MRGAVLLLLLPALVAASAVAQEPAVRRYDFQVLLDDKPIGRHRFEVSGPADARRVTSDAAFAVKVLGLTVYRYRHHAEERWAGECLAALDASTDDDGKAAAVRFEREGEEEQVRVGDARRHVDGCVVDYAYWNPALLQRQSKLLNPQTGRVDAVAVERAGAGTIPVGGKPVAATRWRLSGPEAPVDVWMSEQGEWVGLDSVVRNGAHRLSYRLP